MKPDEIKKVFAVAEDEIRKYRSATSPEVAGNHKQRAQAKLFELLHEYKVDAFHYVKSDKIYDQFINLILEMPDKYGDVIYTEHLISRLIKQQKLNPRSKVPPFNPNYIVLDEEKDILRTLSTRLVDQKQNQQ